MSQILRLCYRNVLQGHKSVEHLALEASLLQGCCQCRAFRSNQSRGPLYKANVVGSTHVKERNCSQDEVSQEWLRRLEKENKSILEELHLKGLDTNAESLKGFKESRPFIYISSDGTRQKRNFNRRLQKYGTDRKPASVYDQTFKILNQLYNEKYVDLSPPSNPPDRAKVVQREELGNVLNGAKDTFDINNSNSSKRFDPKHDLTSSEHNLTSASHEVTSAEHNLTSASHEITSAEHDLTCASHEVTSAAVSSTSKSTKPKKKKRKKKKEAALEDLTALLRSAAGEIIPVDRNASGKKDLHKKKKDMKDINQASSVTLTSENSDGISREKEMTVNSDNIINSANTFASAQSSNLDSLHEVEVTYKPKDQSLPKVGSNYQLNKHQVLNEAEKADADSETIDNLYEADQIELVTLIKQSVDKNRKKDQNEKTTMKEKNKEKAMEEKSERRAVEFNHDLRSFVDACLFTDQADTAVMMLRYYKHKSRYRSKWAVTDVNIYSSLLQHYAKTGSIKKMEDIMDCLRSNQVKPTMQCFAAFFYYLGQHDNIDAVKGKDVLNELVSEGYNIKDIFNDCVLSQKEKQRIHKVLDSLIDGFEPHPSPPVLVPYNNPLLNHLNEAVEDTERVEKNPFQGVISLENLQNQFDQQMAIESQSFITVPSIDKKEQLNQREQKMKNELKKLKESWRVILTKAFKEEVKKITREEKGYFDIRVSPFLKVLPAEDYVNEILAEVDGLCAGSETFSLSAHFLYRELGERIFNLYNIKVMEKNGTKQQVLDLYKEFSKEYVNPDFDYKNHRECWLDLQTSQLDNSDTRIHKWSPYINQKIGRVLYKLMMNKVKFNMSLFNEFNSAESENTNKSDIPAFYYTSRNYAGKTKTEVKVHYLLTKLYQGKFLTDIPFQSLQLPMLVPPVPWCSDDKGGYLINHIDMTRVYSHYLNTVTPKAPPNQVNGVYDALNVLSLCPWKINKPVLEIVIELFNNKGNKDLDIPPPISECPVVPKISLDMTVEQKYEIRIKRQEVRKLKDEMYSLWCNELYKLSIANKYQDNIFWFPHNLDFRGRTYPCPPHLNHLGSDVNRGILLFAKGKPLGKKGLDWLKIHLVNLTGLKKRSSNHERLLFANEMMSEILDSADRPMEGNKWWQTSDEPWQTLAACKEIAMAIRSGNPEKYVSHFPVHQDGSCNGLQHYAALGRDQAGAESVNLCPFPAPKDVYSDVAELVEEIRKKDAENGDKVAQALEGFVYRKVLKQTVMTTVYGVTPFGAREQILRQLNDIQEFPQEHVFQAARYLTAATFQSLEKMFTSTRLIQDWFDACAKVISKACNMPVEWVTPLGLPVLQPYFKNFSNDPNSLKQKNGFPPNFIHSLDSVHMMLTALHCYRAGINYVSVHDCFWTHACDVEIMNKICREQFVALHSQPILDDLSKFMLKKFGDVPQTRDQRQGIKKCFENVPKTGTFDLNNVRKSTYFFS